ncbi:GNAT family N-acetyltransferase [Reyranella sp.]|uniref:GNAT family N-acetyltransferase n=1 Tax=Reyranella sp. TaxID=1929291 RepID=UPI003BACBF15
MNVQMSSVAELEHDPGLAALLVEYAAESSIAGMPVPAARMDSYRELEARGLLRVLSAIHDGRLIGFLTLLVPVLPHYGVAVAVSESFFVALAHRGTGAGLKLLRAAEDLARRLGSPGLLVSAPFEGNLFKVLPRVGYTETNRVFFKKVSDG